MAASNAKRRTLRGLAALAATLTLPARGQNADTGLEYLVIPQQPVPAGDVIEVVEFFWYGCPYCYRLQDPLEAWLTRRPADIVFRRVPAMFRPSWVNHARLYLALETLDALRLHRAAFDAIHIGGNRLDEHEAIAEWMGRQGIPRERWLAAYDDPQMESRLRQAIAQLQQYRITGTPSLVIDGRYLTSSSMTAGVPALIPVLDQLVALTRQQRGSR